MSRTLFIVTGARGGFGSAIMSQLDSIYGSNAAIVACSRKTGELDRGLVSSDIRDVTVDFSERENIKSNCEEIIRTFGDEHFSEVVLINNHASTNDVKRLADKFDDYKEVDDYMFLNFTSFQILTAVFMKEFSQREGTTVSLINISSLASIQGIPSLSLYCAGKAARMMLYKTIALEHPTVTVLNYSPGPMLTAMTHNFSVEAAAPTVREYFKGMLENYSFVNPEESAAKMLNIFKDRKFKSGDQIDFYDRDM